MQDETQIGTEPEVQEQDAAVAESDGDLESTGSFTAETIAGEMVEIVRKETVGDRLVFVTDQGAMYVAPTAGAMQLEPFDEKVHVGGQPVTGEAAESEVKHVLDGKDATEHAEERAAAKEALNAHGVDATAAAEAQATATTESPVTTETPAEEPHGEMGITTTEPPAEVEALNTGIVSPEQGGSAPPAEQPTTEEPPASW